MHTNHRRIYITPLQFADILTIDLLINFFSKNRIEESPATSIRSKNAAVKVVKFGHNTNLNDFSGPTDISAITVDYHMNSNEEEPT